MSIDNIEIKRIKKIYSHNKQALEDVSLCFKKGEVHALVGENGAGKSTLVKILTGYLQPTQGAILIDNKPHSFVSPEDSIQHGIRIVHQKPYLIENATVFENICVGISVPMFFSEKKLKSKIMALMNEFSITLNLSSKVKHLNMEEKFYTAFISAMYKKTDFLILDEPWYDFTDTSKFDFFIKLKQLTARGVLGIILITHTFKEIKDFADKVSILKQGKITQSFLLSENNNMINFFNTSTNNFNTKQNEPKRECILSIKNLTLSTKTITKLKNINLKTYSGHITGIIGTMDNGLASLEKAIFGILRNNESKKIVGDIHIKFNNKDIYTEASKVTPSLLRHYGVGLISSDRYNKSANIKLTIYEMLIANNVNNFFINRKQKTDFVHKILKEECIDANENTYISELSGGEIQRLILARELYNNPKLLILANPEQGLDFKKVDALKKRLISQKLKGTSILILTKMSEEELFKDIFNSTYLLKDGLLSEKTI